MTTKNICAFTGHRPHKFSWKNDESVPECIALKAVLSEQIKIMTDSGFTDFLSGMAEGCDAWAALSVLALREENPKLKLHCILPCTTQADQWTESSRNLYHSILKQADSIVFVHRDFQKNCMLDRNRFLVKHASALLAVYNGERRGGTAATIRYARKAGRDITIIHPVTLQVSHESPAL